ncbi:hypothetical protein BDW74DRAFT_172653 [Aspergillus multicolor]|uniref:uncharacterized protein n=1 Tax=Aspergillus multicolor TaxID=41759 RepID=UPI003CCDCBE2
MAPTLTNSSLLSALSTYTLCDDVYSRYNISDENDLTDAMFANEEWMAEYDRVCAIPVNGPIPTRAFNYSITLDTSDYSYPSTAAVDTPGPSAGGSATATTASENSTTATTSVASTASGLTVSPNGLCGGDTGYTCAGSNFGDCCSKYGYWCVHSISTSSIWNYRSPSL